MNDKLLFGEIYTIVKINKNRWKILWFLMMKLMVVLDGWNGFQQPFFTLVRLWNITVSPREGIMGRETQITGRLRSFELDLLQSRKWVYFYFYFFPELGFSSSNSWNKKFGKRNFLKKLTKLVEFTWKKFQKIPSCFIEKMTRNFPKEKHGLE